MFVALILCDQFIPLARYFYSRDLEGVSRRRRSHAKEKPVRENPSWHAGREPDKHASAEPAHHRFIGSKHNFGAVGYIQRWHVRHRSILPDSKYAANSVCDSGLDGAQHEAHLLFCDSSPHIGRSYVETHVCS